LNSFDTRAKSWDLKERRVVNAKAIAKAIEQKIAFNKSMHIADFGVGTGLLGSFLAKNVAKITGIDNSKAMLKEFLEKDFACKQEIYEVDANKEELEGDFDGIISSMTLHHIKDIEKLFDNFYKILKEGGFIALADLVQEDGSFHSDNSGVYHFGFAKDDIIKIAQKSGFRDISFDVVHTISKPHKDFDVFLLTAKK